MLNIVLKNKTLIKVYKYSVKTIKFLNRHLYLFSILSMISKFRKTNTYKVVNWIIKVIISLNIIFVSGLFVTLIDFETPFDTVYNLYMDLLSPYIEIIKAKANLLLKIVNSVDEVTDQPYDMQPYELLNKQYRSKPLPPIDNINYLDTVADVDTDVSFNAKDLAFFASVAFFAYFFLYLPGLNHVPATELAQYSYLNQGLIEIKMAAKDAIINLLFGNGGGNPPSNPINPSDLPGGSDISLTDGRTISSGSDITVTQGVISPVDSNSPSPFNSPMPRTPRDLGRLSGIGVNSPNLSPTDFDHYFAPLTTASVNVQTELTHVNIIKPILRNTVDTGVQTVNNTVDISIQTDNPSKLLKSIQLLDNNEID
jgi:hypothetical protein